MRMVFDLDGVFRDLGGYICKRYDVPPPQSWVWTHQGKTVFTFAGLNNFAALTESQAMPYLSIAKEYYQEIEIWTCQPETWKPYTEQWLDAHVGKYLVRYLSPDEKRARLDKEKDILLLEDYPEFKNYERILLVDYPYNKMITAERIYNKEQLRERMLNLEEVTNA